MKFHLLIIMVFVSAITNAQVILKTSFKQLNHSIEDDGKTLSMKINGQRVNGEKVRYNQTFDVSSLSSSKIDSLKANILDSLKIAYTFVKADIKSQSVELGQNVLFTCNNCGKKGNLEVYGKDFVSTRKIDSRIESRNFPIAITLRPGNYQLVYYRRGKSQATRLPFTVKEGEKNLVTVD